MSGTVTSRIFSSDQVRGLRALGVNDEALKKLRHACALARAQGWFRRQPPTKKALHGRLAKIKRLATELRAALEDMPGTIGPDLYSRDVEVHELQELLDRLTAAAADIQRALAGYKDVNKAPTLPVVLIGRAVGACIRPAATEGSAFKRVLDICYQAMGASRAQTPSVRTLRQAMRELRPRA